MPASPTVVDDRTTFAHVREASISTAELEQQGTGGEQLVDELVAPR